MATADLLLAQALRVGEQGLGGLEVRLLLLDELRELVLELRLLVLERAQLRLELRLLARALRVLDLRLDLPLVGLVLRQPLDDRRQLLRRLGALADHRPRLRARRGDLLVQRHLLGLELVRGGLELRLLLRVGLRLPLELRLLRLQAPLLLLELLLLRGQLLALRIERVRLRRSAAACWLFPCFCSCSSCFCRLCACCCWLVYSLLGFGGIPSLTATSSGPL